MFKFSIKGFVPNRPMLPSKQKKENIFFLQSTHTVQNYDTYRRDITVTRLFRDETLRRKCRRGSS